MRRPTALAKLEQGQIRQEVGRVVDDLQQMKHIREHDEPRVLIQISQTLSVEFQLVLCRYDDGVFWRTCAQVVRRFVEVVEAISADKGAFEDELVAVRGLWCRGRGSGFESPPVLMVVVDRVVSVDVQDGFGQNKEEH